MFAQMRENMTGRQRFQGDEACKWSESEVAKWQVLSLHVGQREPRWFWLSTSTHGGKSGKHFAPETTLEPEPKGTSAHGSVHALQLYTGPGYFVYGRTAMATAASLFPCRWTGLAGPAYVRRRTCKCKQVQACASMCKHVQVYRNIGDTSRTFVDSSLLALAAPSRREQL